MSTLPLSQHKSPAAPLRALPSRSSRSKSAVVIGVLLIGGFALAFVLTALHVDHRPSVLVVRHAVSAGNVLKADDIGIARVSTDSALQPISATQLNRVVGRPVAVALVPGTLLTNAQLGTATDLQANQTLVGVLVKPGQFPPGLSVGSRVQVVQTATDGTGTVIADGAVVTSVAAPNSSDITAGTVVGLKVDSTASAAVTGASASSHVGLVQEPQS